MTFYKIHSIMILTKSSSETDCEYPLWLNRSDKNRLYSGKDIFHDPKLVHPPLQSAICRVSGSDRKMAVTGNQDTVVFGKRVRNRSTEAEV